MSWLSDSLREFNEKGDKLLLVLCLIASGFGLILIYSATRYLDSSSAARCMMVQCLAIFLGVVAYLLLSSVDIELFTEKSWKFLLAFNVLFILTLKSPWGVGEDTTGNHSWLDLPLLPVNIQPAEIVKLPFILLVAYQCARLQKREVIGKPKAFFQVMGHGALMCGLIAYVSGDFGMVLTFLFLIVLMGWMAGTPKWLFLLCGGGGIGALILIWEHIPSYVVTRFTVVYDHLIGNLEESSVYQQTLGVGWQQTRSILAIGGGGLTGQGYLQGVQTQSVYESSLPARYTDEIFAVCGEEFGMIGCAILLIILLAIILRCFWVAHKACSHQSALISMGFGGMILVQVGVNVGMCLYVFPVVGLTLPFISYGGSSIITMFAAMGVVSSIKMRSLPSWLRDRTKME